MPRFHQLLFALSTVALSWYAILAVHELGHVAGVMITGGSVERVVLHPLAISRTDVSPNPRPGIVVWFGPAVGSVLPLAAFAVVPRRLPLVRKAAQFFAGFCLIANGAYISVGSFDLIGDCGEMFRTGTSRSVMVVFGAVAIPLGLYLWHRLGSPGQFLLDPSRISSTEAYVVFGTLLAAIGAGLMLSPR